MIALDNLTNLCDIAGMKQKQENPHLLLMIPEDQWDVLQQSLILDSQSAGIDRQLRESIKKALDSITPVTGPVAELLDEAEMLPRAGWTTSATTSVRSYFVGQERMNALEKVIQFFRSPFEMLGGKRVYSRKLV